MLHENEKPKHGTRETQKFKPSLLYHLSGAHESIKLRTIAAVPSLTMPLSVDDGNNALLGYSSLFSTIGECHTLSDPTFYIKSIKVHGTSRANAQMRLHNKRNITVGRSSTIVLWMTHGCKHTYAITERSSGTYPGLPFLLGGSRYEKQEEKRRNGCTGEYHIAL